MNNEIHMKENFKKVFLNDSETTTCENTFSFVIPSFKIMSLEGTHFLPCHGKNSDKWKLATIYLSLLSRIKSSFMQY